MKTHFYESNGGSDNSQTAAFQLFTRHEAAAFSRVSIRKLDQAKATGEIAYIAIGRSIRFRDSDLQDWLDRQRVKARRN